ncbi:MAG: hypothetical protein ABL876_08610 [Chitinophagaceae bacterium]
MMRLIIAGIFSMVSSIVFGQSGSNTFKLPEILAPSPDVAALSKAAELQATPHTGAPNARIPVYDLKVGNFSFPVSINYGSNGYKPEEIPSRVGLGWTLNAGGSVSRIVRGKPDDFCTPISQYLDESQLQAYTSTAYYFLEDLEDQSTYHDSQPDEYRYSVNGLSGRFIIKRDGSVLQLPYNNVKIIVIKSQGAVTDILITDGNGVKYKFGEGVIEQTLEHNLVNDFLQKQYITTAWMLTNITLPAGNYINFSYGSLNHYVKSGVMQSVRKGYTEPGAECSQGNNGNNPIPCDVTPQSSSKETLVRYTSRYLTAINTNTGPAIAITYADRPDAGGDNRVDQILVSNGFGTSIKKLQLEYVDRHTATQTPFNEGFFLKKVVVKDPTAITAEQQVFELGYVDEATAGAGASPSFGIDHLGFANGVNNPSLLPANTSQAALFGTLGNANREPNGTHSQKGMLQKLTYPTGGYDEFYYEPNMATWWDSVANNTILTCRNMGYGDVYPYQFYNCSFTVSKTQTAEFHLNTGWFGSPPVPDGDPAPKTAFARLYNNATNEVIAMRRAEGFPGGAHYLVDGPTTVELNPGIQYRFELEVRYGSQAWARADIVYDAAIGKQWKEVKEELCGVRVRKIVSYDPVSRKAVPKFYAYRSLTDTVQPSANKLYYPEYVTFSPKALLCQQDEIVCNGYLLSSNSATSLYANEAAGVTYKWVIESDDSTFSNGGVEHSFVSQGGFIGNTIIGNTIPDPPSDPYNYMNGVETQTLIFSKSRQAVRKTNNYYSIDSRINEVQHQNYIVRKRYETVQAGPAWNEGDFRHIDVTAYSIFTRWDHIDSTVTREFDLTNNEVLTSKVAYTYGNVNNIQPTASSTYGSDNTELRKELKYTTDFPAVPVCSTLVSQNIKDLVVEEKSYKGTKLLYQTNTDYKDWFNNATILTPEIIKSQKNNSTQENRIHYYQYDTKGNPLELSKENDARVTYIWDYNGTLPVAEITNASWGSGVAYTSFEADGKGGWTFSGTPVTENTEPAGKKSYQLGSGSITYSGTMTAGKKYYVTYWAKGGSVSVNGSSGTNMLTKNSWSLYRHLITYSGSGGITISGSGYIDEVRLHPDGAFMKTFTYTPEVGITSTADHNNLQQLYEYDVFNRLLRIRNIDKNILKQFEYKYGSNVTGCTNTTPNWQASGNYRCAKTSPANNNNTGIKEREELDMNNCSATYGEARWVSIGTSAECPVVANCTGPDKRVINGVCYTGCKLLVSSAYLGNLTWNCTFRYYWQQDGYSSPEFTEAGSFHCIGVCD